MVKSISFFVVVFLTAILYKVAGPLYGNLLLLGYFSYKLYKVRFRFFAIVGQKKYRKNDIDGAMSWFEKAISMRECSGGIKASYAYLLLTLGKVNEAYSVIEKASTTNPLEVSSFDITKALILWKKGRLQDAIAILENVHNEQGKSATAYECLGFFYILNDDLEKALAFNKEAVEYDSKSPLIKDNLAYTYFKLNDFEEALPRYEAILSENPSFMEPYYYTSQIYLSQGNVEKAKELLEKALKLQDSFLSKLSKAEIQKFYDEITSSECALEKNN